MLEPPPFLRLSRVKLMKFQQWFILLVCPNQKLDGNFTKTINLLP